MNSCGKRIFLFFGMLLIIALLFVPYKSTHTRIKNTYGPYSGIKSKTTTTKSGYAFLAKLFSSKPFESSYTETRLETNRLNTKLFLIEIGVIVFLAGFDYLLFCFLPRKKRRVR
ncbi:MAG: hypothetical protein ACE5LC_01790 [Candidatus Aminicenantales bacterium]